MHVIVEETQADICLSTQISGIPTFVYRSIIMSLIDAYGESSLSLCKVSCFVSCNSLQCS
jgi:hypothetical protein